MLKNQLYTQLSYNYPSYNKFFSEVDGRTALAFWHEFLLEGVTLEDLTLFLRKNSNNVCSTKKAVLILEGVQTDGNAKRNGQKHRDFLVRSHVNQIRDVHREMTDVENHIRDIM
nr:hypothetical protein [Paenibacillus ehimensis]